MKKLCLLIGAIATVCPLLVSAKDIVVQFIVDETGKRTLEIAPMVLDGNGYFQYANYELNESDSTFVYKGLSENQKLLVAYQLDDKIKADRLRFDSDTITYYIPSFYLNEPKMRKEVTETASYRMMSKKKET